MGRARHHHLQGPGASTHQSTTRSEDSLVRAASQPLIGPRHRQPTFIITYHCPVLVDRPSHAFMAGLPTHLSCLPLLVVSEEHEVAQRVGPVAWGLVSRLAELLLHAGGDADGRADGRQQGAAEAGQTGVDCRQAEVEGMGDASRPASSKCAAAMLTQPVDLPPSTLGEQRRAKGLLCELSYHGEIDYSLPARTAGFRRGLPWGKRAAGGSEHWRN